MAALAVAAALFTIVTGAFDVAAPLWATFDLGLGADDWARLRSLRMLGTFVGIAVLGVAAERLGARSMGAVAMAGGAGALAAMAGGGTTAAAIAMPVFGACISSGFVNLNVLTQAVSERRQALANSLYRGVGATTAIVAPGAALAVAAMSGSYAGALAVASLMLVAGGVATLLYPVTARTGDPPTLAGVFAAYARALRLPRMMRFIGLEQGWFATHSAVGAFAAIRFTRELGLDRAAFGTICTAAAIAALLGTLASGPLSERMGPQRFMALLWSGCSACALVMGLSDVVPASACAFVLYSACLASCSAPASMWVSRAAGDTSHTVAFTVYKIAAAGAIAATMAVLGVIEPRFGMQAIFLVGGALGLPFALALLRLRG